MQHSRSQEKGFTLIELLVVVAIIGVLAAIAIVNFLVALDKSRQKKTMSDMRAIATAWEARSADAGAYTAAGQSVFNWPSEVVTQTELETILSPTYIRPMPRKDGWSTQFGYAVEVPGVAGAGSTIYAIRSAGKDRQFESSYESQFTSRFDCDIVYSGGQFIVLPETH